MYDDCDDDDDDNDDDDKQLVTRVTVAGIKIALRPKFITRLQKNSVISNAICFHIRRKNNENTTKTNEIRIYTRIYAYFRPKNNIT